jgi:hypothetical protein
MNSDSSSLQAPAILLEGSLQKLRRKGHSKPLLSSFPSFLISLLTMRQVQG